ncbi:peptidoglycan-binding protein [Candidatus Sumerlaeota bacterium]|nr:peptidoglycan-binding protein [Candidatus Sumerlaeota bacterium]
MKTKNRNAKLFYAVIAAALILVLCAVLLWQKANTNVSERFPTLNKSIINDLPPTPTPNVMPDRSVDTSNGIVLADDDAAGETTSANANAPSALDLLNDIKPTPTPAPASDSVSSVPISAVAASTETSATNDIEMLKEALSYNETSVSIATSTPKSEAPKDAPVTPILQETEVPSLSEDTPKAPEPTVAALAETSAPATMDLLAEKGSVPRIGNKEDVKRLQTALQVAGVSQDPVDGIWGPKTGATISKYQSDNDLEVTGRPGPRTWNLLYNQAKGIAPTTPVVPASPTSSDAASSDTATTQAAALADTVAELLKEKGSVPKIWEKADVKRLQTALRTAGLSEEPVDGIWGEKTSDIITKFQQENGLETTGKPGPQTWTLLYKQVQEKMQGGVVQNVAKPETTGAAEMTSASVSSALSAVSDLLKEKGSVPKIWEKTDVKRLQTALRTAGLSEEPVDGIWGEKTSNIITKFQQENGLETTGKPGPKTWELLYSKVAAVKQNGETPTEPQAPVADKPVQQEPVSTTATEQLTTASAPTATSPENDAKEAQPVESPSGTAPDVAALLGEKGRVPRIYDDYDVKRLQAALRITGYSNEAIDGLWGDKTSVAVTEFQKRHNLETTGKPGKLTWGLLYPQAKDKLTAKDTQDKGPAPQVAKVTPGKTDTKTSSSDDTLLPPTELPSGKNTELTYKKPEDADGESESEKITRVQNRLNDLGYKLGSPTGTLGPRTRQAIRDIQKSNDLPETGNLDDSKTVDAIFGRYKRASFARTTKRERTIDVPSELAFLESSLRSVNKNADPDDVAEIESLLDRARTSDAETAKSLLNDASVRISKLNKASQNDAQSLFSDVEKQYKRFKTMFGEKLKKDNKATYGKIEKAYSSMKSDLANEAYDNVMRLGPGFKNSMDQIVHTLSKDYVSKILATPSMTKQLSSDLLAKVKSLHRQGRSVEAAELAQKELKKSPQSSSKK